MNDVTFSGYLNQYCSLSMIIPFNDEKSIRMNLVFDTLKFLLNNVIILNTKKQWISKHIMVMKKTSSKLDSHRIIKTLVGLSFCCCTSEKYILKYKYTIKFKVHFDYQSNHFYSKFINYYIFTVHYILYGYK